METSNIITSVIAVIAAIAILFFGLANGWRYTFEKIWNAITHFFNHTLHLDLIWKFAFKAHKVVAEHGVDSPQAKKIAEDFFMAFMSMATFIAVGGITLVKWLGGHYVNKYISGNYNLLGYNVDALWWSQYALYLFVIILAVVISFYCLIIVMVLGRRGVGQGRLGLYFAGDVPIEKLDATSGARQTYPGFGGATKVLSWESEFAIRISIDGSTMPTFLTAHHKSAFFPQEGKELTDEQARFENDPLHKYRSQLTKKTVVFVYQMTDQLIFFRDKISIDELRRRLKDISQAAVLETMGVKTMAMSIGSQNVETGHMKVVASRELENYGKFMKCLNVLGQDFDFAFKKAA